MIKGSTVYGKDLWKGEFEVWSRKVKKWLPTRLGENENDELENVK